MCDFYRSKTSVRAMWFALNLDLETLSECSMVYQVLPWKRFIQTLSVFEFKRPFHPYSPTSAHSFIRELVYIQRQENDAHGSWVHNIYAKRTAKSSTSYQWRRNIGTLVLYTMQYNRS